MDTHGSYLVCPSLTFWHLTFSIFEKCLYLLSTLENVFSISILMFFILIDFTFHFTLFHFILLHFLYSFYLFIYFNLIFYFFSLLTVWSTILFTSRVFVSFSFTCVPYRDMDTCVPILRQVFAGAKSPVLFFFRFQFWWFSF